MTQRKRRRSRAKDPGGLPKGAWPLPTGGYALAGPPWNHHGQDIRIVGVRRHPSAAEVARLIIEIAPHLLDEPPDSASPILARKG